MSLTYLPPEWSHGLLYPTMHRLLVQALVHTPCRVDIALVLPQNINIPVLESTVIFTPNGPADGSFGLVSNPKAWQTKAPSSFAKSLSNHVLFAVASVQLLEEFTPTQGAPTSVLLVCTLLLHPLFRPPSPGGCKLAVGAVKTEQRWRMRARPK